MVYLANSLTPAWPADLLAMALLSVIKTCIYTYTISFAQCVYMYNNYYIIINALTLGAYVIMAWQPKWTMYFLYNNSKMYGKRDPFVQTVRCGNETPRLTFLWPYFSHTGNFLACLHARTHKWYIYMYALVHCIHVHIHVLWLWRFTLSLFVTYYLS